MTALLIGQDEVAAIRALREKAAAAPIPLAEMMERAAAFEEGKPTAGFDDLSIPVPIGYFLTFTIEHQPGAVCRHMSLSVDRAGRMPNTVAIGFVMDALGFINPLDRCAAWVEDLDDGGHAINVVEPVDGNMRSIAKDAR